MRLSQYLEPDRVLIGLDTNGVEDTIRRLVDPLAETGAIGSADAIASALLDRERSHTTSLGNGVALPHAIVPDIERPVIVVATAPDGIRFGPVHDDETTPDRLFFLLLSPTDAAGRHIKILARIVRLVRSPDFVHTLLDAATGDQLVSEIEREDALHV